MEIKYQNTISLPTNTENYLNTQKVEIRQVISSWENFDSFISMEDDSPVHFVIVVRERLNDQFPRKWMGRQVPHEKPARNPNFIPCVFFLQRWLKEQIYSTKPTTLEKLEGQIR